MGINIGAGTAFVVVSVIVAAALPGSVGSWRVVPVALAVATTGVLTADSGAVLFVSVVAYLLITGFLVNRLGVLSWHGTADLYRLLVIAASAGVGLAVSAGWRWTHRPAPLLPPPEWVAFTSTNSEILMNVNKEDVPGD